MPCESASPRSFAISCQRLLAIAERLESDAERCEDDEVVRIAASDDVPSPTPPSRRRNTSAAAGKMTTDAERYREKSCFCSIAHERARGRSLTQPVMQVRAREQEVGRQMHRPLRKGLQPN